MLGEKKSLARSRNAASKTRSLLVEVIYHELKKLSTKKCKTYKIIIDTYNKKGYYDSLLGLTGLDYGKGINSKNALGAWNP